MEPKFKRGQWVEVHPPYALIAPELMPDVFVAQVADITIGKDSIRYDLIQPGDPYPMTDAPERNLRPVK